MNPVDLLVIGAGIQGAGVAQAAAAAGFSVLVLEKAMPAYGTSSRSSKLIHGGLRYLETGQFGLVRESLHERTLMLRNAPELVRLKPFYIPIYKSTRRRSWQIAIGLTLYQGLAGFGPGSGFGLVPRRDWDQLDGLNTDGLQRVFRYHDAQTDDAALTRAVLKSAISLGAELKLSAEVLKLELQPDTAEVVFSDQGQQQTVSARVVINATGPWVSELLQRVTPVQNPPSIDLIKGSHLVLPGQVSQGNYYLEHPRDGRAIFVMPWYGQTLLGTTEVRYRGDPDRVEPSSAEINYLLSCMANYFPSRGPLSSRDVTDSFAGLRVLPAGPGHAFRRSRESLILLNDPQCPRLASIFGGKLTGWRANADKVMQLVIGSLPTRIARADTRNLRLEPDN